MVNGFYRIGQASKHLGVSSYHLRRLCEAGAIDAELTSGNQWAGGHRGSPPGLNATASPDSPEAEQGRRRRGSASR